MKFLIEVSIRPVKRLGLSYYKLLLVNNLNVKIQ
jgi:hypothetical protein